MYESFFGLTGPAFRLTPDPSFLFHGKGHRDAFGALQVGLAAGARVMVLTGEVGAGKTTLLQTLLASVDATTTVMAQISAARLDGETLCEQLCEALGLPQQPDSLTRRDVLMAALASALRPTLLVIDEAQHLAPSALLVLENLANATAVAPVRLQICLVGQPELRILLNAGQRRAFRELIDVDRHLGPLERGEIRLYVEHRLHRAGWTGRPEFEDAAFTEIFIFTSGNPRRVNLLCNSLMLCACLKKQQTIDAAAVTWAAAAMREDAFQGGPDLLDLGAHFQHRPTLTQAFEPETTEPKSAAGPKDGLPMSGPISGDGSALAVTPSSDGNPASPSDDAAAGTPGETISAWPGVGPSAPPAVHVDAATNAHAPDEPASAANNDQTSDEVEAVAATPLRQELPTEVTTGHRRPAILATAASIGVALALLAYFVGQQGLPSSPVQKVLPNDVADSTTARAQPPMEVDPARRAVGSVAPESSAQPSASAPSSDLSSRPPLSDAAAIKATQDDGAHVSRGGQIPVGTSAASERAGPAGSAAERTPPPVCSGPALALGLCDADSSSPRRQ